MDIQAVHAYDLFKNPYGLFGAFFGPFFKSIEFLAGQLRARGPHLAPRRRHQRRQPLRHHRRRRHVLRRRHVRLLSGQVGNSLFAYLGHFLTLSYPGSMDFEAVFTGILNNLTLV